MSHKSIHKKGIILGGILAVAVIGLLVGFFVVKGRSEKYFASGTVINGTDVSKMSLEQLNQKIGHYSLKVVEKKKNGSTFTETINGKNFGIGVGTNEGAVKDLLHSQTVWQYLFGKGKKHKVKEWLVYDKSKMDQVISSLACFDETQVVNPQNAHISDYNKESGAYEIIAEQDGNAVDRAKTKAVIQSAITALKNKVDLDKEDCYLKAEMNKDDEQLKDMLSQLNRYAKAKITYRFGDKEEVVDGSLISQWLKVTKKNRVILQKEKISEYIAKLRQKYDTIFRDRKFKTSYGKTVTVKGGDYGWWMNYQKEEKELMKLLKAGKTCERTPEYYQKALSYGSHDYGDTYIEINLTTQHVFLYVKGKKIMETDCVTGNSARGFDTPEGTYSITYKQKNATLNGENYSTPVNYWMPFNKNIGLHDAYWRSRFGGEEYKRNGSHGCVNLPPENAKKLYRYVEAGMPVICYYYQPEKKQEKMAAEDTAKKKIETKKTTETKKTSDKSKSAKQSKTHRSED